MYSPVFSCRSFTVLWSFFELIFVPSTRSLPGCITFCNMWMSVLKALFVKKTALPLHLFERSINSVQVYFLGFSSVNICFSNTTMSWLLYLYTKSWSGLMSSDIVTVIEYCWLFWDSPLHINLYFVNFCLCLVFVAAWAFLYLLWAGGCCLFWCLGFLLWWLLWSTDFSCCGLCSCDSQTLEHSLSSCGAHA